MSLVQAPLERRGAALSTEQTVGPFTAQEFALDREALELLAERGLYFDPHTFLLLQNYFDNGERYYGVGQYSPEYFRQLREGASDWLEVFREALTVPGLRVVFGTDAVAGAHGRNWEELAYRVHEGGQDPMDAIISATSLAAEALGRAAEIGRIEEGLLADLIATLETLRPTSTRSHGSYLS